MRKYFCILALLCGFAVAARGQTLPATANISASDSGTCATAAACLVVRMPTNAASSVVQITGTFSATLQFEGTTQIGGTFVAVNAVPVGGTTAVTSATSTGAWRIAVAGLAVVRVRCSTYASGTAVVAITTSLGSSANNTSSGGGGGSGTVTSVDMTVPGGFAVSGNPITTSGTLALTTNPAGADYLLTSTAANTSAWNQVNTGSSCGDGTHAIKYDATAHVFGCQALTTGGAGTVTSVAQTVPSWLSVAGSPITLSGTLAITAAAAQTSHQVIGTCGSATTFAPCALVAGDIPTAIPIANIGSAGLSGTSPIAISAAGAISCSTCVTGTPVTAFSGDGTFASNSSSTGAVTLTLATAGAHKWWGNNTGSTAAPGYQSIGTADLPSAIPIGNVGSAGLSGTSPVTISAAGAIGCATCTTNASALTANDLMSGAGGQASQIITGWSSNNTSTITAGSGAILDMTTNQSQFKAYPCAPQFSTTDTLNNSSVTTEQVFATNCQIPANALVANKVLRVWLGVDATMTTSPSYTFKMKLCSVSGCGSGTVVNTYVTPTNTVVTSFTGVSGGVSFVIQGAAAAGSSVAVNTSVMVNPDTAAANGPFGHNTLVTSQTGVPTNGNLFLSFSITYSSTTGTNSMTLTQLVTEWLN